MKNKNVGLLVLFLALLYSAVTLPEKLMILPFEYVGMDAYPKATYSAKPKAFGAIVRLKRYSGFVCSGTVISDQYMLTAAHCVSKQAVVQVGGYSIADTNDSVNRDAAVAFAYGVHDIAILYGDFSDFEVKKVDWEGALINSKQGLTCGFPQGQARVMCANYEIGGNSFFYIRGVGHTFQGSSGGPLLVNDTVLGVNSHVSFSSVMVGPVIGMQEMFEAFNGKN